MIPNLVAMMSPVSPCTTVYLVEQDAGGTYVAVGITNTGVDGVGK